MSSATASDVLEAYNNHFLDELNDARGEVYRLNELLKEALWYNFEVAARDWKYPWRETWLGSSINMAGTRHCKHDGIEYCDFPFWYIGTVGDAPPLPIEIVKKELDAARDHVRMCEIATTAAFDWAPGGPLFLELRAATLVGK